MPAIGMSNSNFGSGSLFDDSAATVYQSIRRLGFFPVRVARANLRLYESHEFVVGWDVQQIVDGEFVTLRVLLDRSFPLSPIRIAIASRDVYMQWPHVEGQGVLCLPKRPPPISAPAEEVEAALYYATELVRHCLTDPTYIDTEFREEFISYWNRLVSSSVKHVWSLLGNQNTDVREIFVWRGQQFRLAADSKEELKRWLSNRFEMSDPAIEKGLFGHLNQPPIPPFPHDIPSFTRLLEAECPGLVAPLNARFAGDTGFLVLLGATTKTGSGLVAAEFGLRSHKGYRPRRGHVWKGRGYVERKKALRIDPAWVHGRDVNEEITVLVGSTVTIVGCGSLGSHVAMRLAQLGVGSFVLVDPEVLEPSNVGRHALGMNYVGKGKAQGLATEIKQRFPHIRAAEPVVSRWGELREDILEKIRQSDLIVSCVGDFAAESEINLWHFVNKGEPKIIYGWLDEYGSASHALSVFAPSPCFNCVVGPDGRARDPEAIWSDGALGLLTEPACGTYFHPFGPLAVSDAERLVVRTAIDALTGRINTSMHRVHAAATAALALDGGKWSPTHLEVRRAGYTGPFDYEKAFFTLPGCEVCGAHA